MSILINIKFLNKDMLVKEKKYLEIIKDFLKMDFIEFFIKNIIETKEVF
jgi:hypothetical protein